MQVKSSSWVIKKEYFKVMAVDNFKDLFIKNYDREIEDNENEFIDKLCSLREFYVYQYPYRGDTDESADYFEKEDCNFVLKRDMFIILEDA